MKELNMVDLRNWWEPLSTPELEAMLQAELDRRPPDDEKVILLLHILEAREKDLPLQLSAREEEAWQRYKQKVMSRKGKKQFPIRWLSVAASIVLIVTVLVSVVPQQAEAESFWEMLQRMTSTLMEYISPWDRFDEVEENYSFKTDHPGLQQVYDAVVELGVIEPVVPMWLPDGCEITILSNKNTPMLKGVWAIFSNGDSEIVYKLDVYNGEPAHQYYKDDTHYESHEREGTTYHITRNDKRWVVIWEKENIECSITLDCTEDTLWRILESIYVTEDE